MAWVAAGSMRPRAIRRLVVLQRVELAPGQSRSVSLRMHPRLLAGFDIGERPCGAVGGGAMAVTMSRSADDAALSAPLAMPALRLEP